MSSPSRPPALPPAARDRAEAIPSLPTRIVTALALWSMRRGIAPDAALDEFAATAAEATGPGELEEALVRLAHKASGSGVLRVELLRDRGWGPRRVATWPPTLAKAGSSDEDRPATATPSGPGTTTTTIEVPLRCGGQGRGTLRVVLQGPRPIGAERHRRLATLAVLAAAADPGVVDAHSQPLATTPGSSPTHDGLTGLPNAAFLESFLTYALALADRRGEPISLLSISVDRLAAIRETHGAEIAGDAIRTVGQAIARTLRSSDLIARLDDGRLVAVLPGASAASALVISESIRSAVAAAGVPTTRMPVLTVSVGAGTFPDHAADASSLRSASAAALSEARSKGRDKIAAAPSVRLAEPQTLLRLAQPVG